MCGIAGFVGKTSKKSLEAMISRLHHRGPDGEGIYWTPQAGLANRRLAIIDRKGGKQPQTNEDGTLTITYNGEIYNYQELRSQLVNKGHKFKSNSDTEVALHAYEQYGPECLQKFNGMFSFAIWDSKNRSLFASRDRLGIKPLFYSQTDNNFIFASEIKSLLAHPEIKTTPNLKALLSYLTFRYIPEPETIFKGIYHLKPAHYLIFKKGKKTTKRYWRLPEKWQKFESQEEAAEKLLDLLRDSVEKRLAGEVPIASYISGGIDSALVSAFAAQGSEAIKTFNVSFKEPQYDESEYASLVSDHLNLKSKTLELRPTDISVLPKVIWHLDQPLADASTIPMYQLSKLARRYAGVVLLGDGADELFAGYAHYKRLLYGRMLAKFIRIPKILSGIFYNNQTIVGKGLRFLERGNDKTKQFLSLVGSFSETKKLKLLNSHMLTNRTILEQDSMIKKLFSTREDHLTQLLKTDLSIWLPGDILLKTDRMTMAHGLEARVPFLDHRLVEFAMKMPPNLKIKGLKEKYIEREAAESMLPEKIAQRKKHGFNVPLEQFAGPAKKLLTEKAIKRRSWFRPEEVTRIIKGKEKVYIRQTFSLLILEIWARIYIDKQDPSDLSQEFKHLNASSKYTKIQSRR